MRKLFDAANRYVETSDWKTIAALKFCLISLGVIVGMGIGRKYRKKILFTAGTVFLATYIPLMVKFYNVLKESRES